MKLTVRILVIASLCLVCFAAGFFTRHKFYPVSDEFGDYALTNLLNELAYASYLKQGRNTELRSLIDVSINSHLSKVVRHKGTTLNSEAINAKNYILVKIGNLWAKEPPFQTPDFQQSKGQFWYPEWEGIYKANTELLSQAKIECAKTNCNNSLTPHSSGTPNGAP
ncbi:MAG: hypothetical protein WBL28_05245 [Methylotenera sp.]